jgi:hypothetical protein
MFYFLVLCAAVGIPYFSAEWNKDGSWFGRSGSAAPAAGGTATGGVAAPATATSAGTVNSASTADSVIAAAVAAQRTAAPTPPVVDLTEALRFEVTSAWVLGRWPRVTAGLPEANLQGYRVPLVTGTREDDLAGSLTYYFNKNQRCQRITFQGTTGDARKLIAYLTQQYGFKQQTSNDPNLYLYQIRWNGASLSELHIRPARVVKADAPMARFEVLLALNGQQAK